ncbi:MAG TPA: cysteine dioxygenase family protein [Lapillicoccus sp.]|nr:cysteine dioxygenase family protein [Lapillicoccus sp.]
MTALSAHLDAPRFRRPVRLAELRQTARRYALNPNLAALLPNGTRLRTWARLAGDARMDVWVISWPEGTETGWHDHGEASGAFAVASGVVLEQTWALGAVQHRTLAEGDTRSFGPDHVHNVVGVGPGRALTVHAYAPALVTMGRFELGPGGPVQLADSQNAPSW